MNLEEIINRVAKLAITSLDRRLKAEAYDPFYKRLAYESRVNKDGNWTRKKSQRQILNIPQEVYTAAVKQYGEEIFSDKKLLKEVLKHDEVLRSYLTVPLNTL